MEHVLSIIADILLLATCPLYFFQVYRGMSIPNPATCVIVLIVSSLNAGSYFFVADSDLMQSSIAIVHAFNSTVILIYAFGWGKVGPLESMSKITLVLAFAAGILWWFTKDPVLTNLIIQVVFFMAFIPAMTGVVQGHLKEAPFAWCVGIVAYIFMISSVLVSDKWGWEMLVYPIVSGVFRNFCMLTAMWIRKQKAS
ncbi:MAG: hypothetical protein ABIH21_00405 [Patescibacteria group bacterium]